MPRLHETWSAAAPRPAARAPRRPRCHRRPPQPGEPAERRSRIDSISSRSAVRKPAGRLLAQIAERLLDDRRHLLSRTDAISGHASGNLLGSSTAGAGASVSPATPLRRRRRRTRAAPCRAAAPLDQLQRQGAEVPRAHTAMPAIRRVPLDRALARAAAYAPAGSCSPLRVCCIGSSYVWSSRAAGSRPLLRRSTQQSLPSDSVKAADQLTIRLLPPRLVDLTVSLQRT